MLMFTLAISYLKVYITLIHGLNIPGSYAILFFTAYDFSFTTRHTHMASFLLWPSSSFFIEPFICSSPVTYWTPTDLGVHLSMSYLFAFSYCLQGSWGKSTEVVFHSLLQFSFYFSFIFYALLLCIFIHLFCMHLCMSLFFLHSFSFYFLRNNLL